MNDKKKRDRCRITGRNVLSDRKGPNDKVIERNKGRVKLKDGK